MENLRISEALDNIFELLRKCNKYIDDTAPWTLAKEEKYDRLKTILYNLLESIRIATVLLQPFLPDTSERVFEQLRIKEKGIETLDKFGYIEENHQLGEPEVLFKRIDL